MPSGATDITDPIAVLILHRLANEFGTAVAAKPIHQSRARSVSPMAPPIFNVEDPTVAHNYL